MGKTLILKSDMDDYEKFYIEHMQKKNVVTKKYLNGTSKVWNSIGIIWTKYLQFPFANLFYGGWKRTLKEYDTVILFDRILGYPIIRYINKKNPKCRIIVWYWNTGKKMVPKNLRNKCECWSFDETECKRYGLRYNTQFYFKPQKSLQSRVLQDVFFVGLDKQRKIELDKMMNILQSKGFTTKFVIVNDKMFAKGKDGYAKPLKYKDVVQNILHSRCIVEYIKNGQSGLTLRSLESIFFERKLITTNRGILQEPFYCPENIFIWGKDDINNLQYFINSSYKKLEDEIVEKYTFDKWLENFNVI